MAGEGRHKLPLLYLLAVARVTGELLAQTSPMSSLRADPRSARKGRDEELSGAHLCRCGCAMNSWVFGSISLHGGQSNHTRARRARAPAHPHYSPLLQPRAHARRSADTATPSRASAAARAPPRDLLSSLGDVTLQSCAGPSAPVAVIRKITRRLPPVESAVDMCRPVVQPPSCCRPYPPSLPLLSSSCRLAPCSLKRVVTPTRAFHLHALLPCPLTIAASFRYDYGTSRCSLVARRIVGDDERARWS